MANQLSIKRNITIRAVVTPRWKEEAEREISQAISTTDQQLAQLEQEGQEVVNEIRRQSANPLDPRIQEQVAGVQQQVAAKRAELEEQKRNLLDQQVSVQGLEMEQIVDQGQLESSCTVEVGDNLVEKLQASIVVRDGVVESLSEGAGSAAIGSAKRSAEAADGNLRDLHAGPQFHDD